MLHGGSHEPIAIGDGKLIHRLSPFLGRTPAPLQSAVMLRSASQISLAAALSLGKCPRVFMVLRNRALMLSIAFGRVDHPANGRREREELRRANQVLKLTSAFFARAELDRRLKS